LREAGYLQGDEYTTLSKEVLGVLEDGGLVSHVGKETEEK
jgi:hypothetical protein